MQSTFICVSLAELYSKLENDCEKKTNASIVIRYNRKKCFHDIFPLSQQSLVNTSYWNSHLFYSANNAQFSKFIQNSNYFKSQLYSSLQ